MLARKSFSPYTGFRVIRPYTRTPLGLVIAVELLASKVSFFPGGFQFLFLHQSEISSRELCMRDEGEAGME